MCVADECTLITAVSLDCRRRRHRRHSLSRSLPHSPQLSLQHSRSSARTPTVYLQVRSAVGAAGMHSSNAAAHHSSGGGGGGGSVAQWLTRCSSGTASRLCCCVSPGVLRFSRPSAHACSDSTVATTRDDTGGGRRPALQQAPASASPLCLADCCCCLCVAAVSLLCLAAVLRDVCQA